MKKLYLFTMILNLSSYLITNVCANVSSLDWTGDQVSKKNGFKPLSLCKVPYSLASKKCCVGNESSSGISTTSNEFNWLVEIWQRATIKYGPEASASAFPRCSQTNSGCLAVGSLLSNGPSQPCCQSNVVVHTNSNQVYYDLCQPYGGACCLAGTATNVKCNYNSLSLTDS